MLFNYSKMIIFSCKQIGKQSSTISLYVIRLMENRSLIFRKLEASIPNKPDIHKVNYIHSSQQLEDHLNFLKKLAKFSQL